MPWEKEYGYAQSVKVGDTIYLSGQVSHDDRGNIVGLGDMEAQMRQAYANIQKVLAQYGAAMENIVDEILFGRISFPAPLLLQAPSYKFSVLPFLSS
jgi:enamine deaminase RidA (YjgF/YER057c/UK114 family)